MISSPLILILNNKKNLNLKMSSNSTLVMEKTKTFTSTALAYLLINTILRCKSLSQNPSLRNVLRTFCTIAAVCHHGLPPPLRPLVPPLAEPAVRYLQWMIIGPAPGNSSCLLLTSERKLRTQPGSSGTPWSGQLRYW